MYTEANFKLKIYSPEGVAFAALKEQAPLAKVTNIDGLEWSITVPEDSIKDLLTWYCGGETDEFTPQEFVDTFAVSIHLS
jgi:hypothetical protein